MFYGPRTNAEFVVHNGFIYLENENDAIEIKLGKNSFLQFFKLGIF